MWKLVLLVITTVIMALAPALMSSAFADCPDASLGETAQDCPWAGIARELIAASDRGEDVSAKFKQLLPNLAAQVEKDGKNTSLKKLWGTSINFDENAKGIVVHPPIYDMLAGIFGVAPANGRLVHAGLEHTYGYLFSTLRTSFGYKRARWVQGEIERGFGLPEGTLGPLTKKGTLLTNITAFIASISLSGRQTLRDVPSAIASFSYRKLDRIRLAETVTEPRKIVIRTDLVPFTHYKPNTPQENSHLLIYSILDSSIGREQLITAFPVNTGFVNTALDPKNLGEHQKINTRYNAHVEGLSGTPRSGTREVLRAARN